MKKWIVGVLISSLLLEGCYVSHSLTREELDAKMPKEDEKAWFVLRDGRTISTDPWRHLLVGGQGDVMLIFGGKLITPGGGATDTLLSLPAEVFDSLAAPGPGSGPTSGERTVLRLSDSTSLEFDAADTLRVTMASGAGYACAGRIESRHEQKPYSGVLPHEEIEEVRVGRFSVLPTILVLATAAGIVIGVLATADFSVMGGGVNVDLNPGR